MEPDRNRGYAYLQGTHDILKSYTESASQLVDRKLKYRSNKIAVVLHIHYLDLWEEMQQFLSNLPENGFDLYVSITNFDEQTVRDIRSKYPDSNIVLTENRGRDILPFLRMYRHILEQEYDAVCKVHAKKSVYRSDGAVIRNELLDSLIGSHEIVDRIISKFDSDEELGLLSKNKYLIRHTDKNMTFDKDIATQLSELMGFEFSMRDFPAGSMYWFRPKALEGLEQIKDSWFGQEEGLADGTVAHAIERVICNIVRKNGFRVGSL